MRAAKYGITKDYVMALELFYSNGDIIVAGKKQSKMLLDITLQGILIASEEL